jgi:hypothetical protein
VARSELGTRLRLAAVNMHVEPRVADEAAMRALFEELNAAGVAADIEVFRSGDGTLSAEPLAKFLRQTAERLEFSEEEKQRAGKRSSGTIAKWLYRFEEFVGIPRGHLHEVAKQKVQAYAFGDYLLRVAERIGLGGISRRDPAAAWQELKSRCGVRGLEAVGPEDPLPRGLAAALVVRHLGLDDIDPIHKPFDDVPLAYPASREIAILRTTGVIGGWLSQNLFRPDQPISHFEMAKILAGVLRVKTLGTHAGTRAFYAHSSADKEFVRRLKSELEIRGVPGWIDEERVRAGRGLASFLADAISAPEVVVIATISAQSVASHWVSYELQLALGQTPDRPRIVPVKIDDVEMPPFLRHVAYVQFPFAHPATIEEAAEFERNCEELLAAIQDVDMEAAIRPAP